jgi:cell division protein FtsA
MGKKNSIVVGLDIGTSKICAAVGEMTERGLEIIGIGLHP